MQRLLPALAAFALVIAGVGGGILLLTSRDHSSISATTPAAGVAGTSSGPYGLPVGNVVITYGKQSDRIRIDRLAERLGAIDTKAARTAGQALVSKKVRAGTIVGTNGTTTVPFPSTTDPRLASFVRQYLGRTS